VKDAGAHSRGFNLLMAGTVAVAAATWVMGSSAQAQSQRGSLSSDSVQIAQSDVVVFDIPPQSLRSALTSFAEQSGWQLFYSANMAEGLQSPGVSGSSTREAALRRILGDTGLDFKVTESGTVTLVQAAPAPAIEPAVTATETPSAVTARDEAPKPVKVPEIVVKEVRERDDAKAYVAEDTRTATKTDIPLIETPQSITVITRKRMVDQEVHTLAEALRYTPGVQAETFGFEPRFTWLRFRGFDATTDGLFKDGLQLRNPGFALGYSLEPYGAEQIDILRGPSSFLYGQGSPGGLLNYISKRPTTASIRELQFLVGNFGRYEGRMDFGGRLADSDTFSYRLTGLFRESGTQFDHVPNDRVYIAPAFTWRINSDTQVTFFANYQKDTLGSSQAFPADGSLRFNPNGRIAGHRFTGQPGVDKYDRVESSFGYELRHQFTANWSFLQKFRYNQTKVDDVTVFSSGFDPDLRTVQRGVFGSFGNLTSLALDNQIHGSFATGPFQHRVVGGLDFQRIGVHSRQTFAAASPIDIFNPNDFGAPFLPPPTFLDQQTTQFQTGLYIQDQIKFLDHWLLTVGGRHDWTSNKIRNNLTGLTSEQDDQKATGRAALTYVFDMGLAPYVSWSTFFLPSIGVNASGQPFTPETGRQYEFGIKYQPPGTRSLFTAALFDLTRENYVQFDPGTFLPIQRGKARSRGLELEGLMSFKSGLDVIASYTFLDNEVLETVNPAEKGKRLVQTPAQFGSIWGKYTFPNGPFKGLGIGGGARYTGSTYGNETNTFNVPSFVLGDAMVDYAWKNYRVAVNVNNILNQDHYGCFVRTPTDFCSPGERRTVVATVAYRW
jgi:iron complex outermembrane recepter protein